MKTVTVENATSYFSALPSEKSRDYEKKIAKYAEKLISLEDIEVLNEMVSSNHPCAYEAFFCLCTLYRRRKDFELMRDLIQANPQFKKRISYNHILVQYYVHSESFYDYEDILSMAYRDSQLFDDNAGYLQSFCNAFITICEQCNDVHKAEIIQEWYKIALDSITKAIELDPEYAKFYCTKARILSLDSRWQEADFFINQAISKENSSRPDYALTIQNYLFHKLENNMRMNQSNANKRIADLEKQIENWSHMCSTVNLIDENIQPLSLEPEVTYQKHNPKPYDGNDQYVFVSYSHMDSEIVFQMIRKIQDNHINVWYDEGIEVGSEWPEVIGNRLLDSSAIVLIMSVNALRSSHVRREANLAISADLPIFLILIDDVELSPGMKLQFGLTQMISMNKFAPDAFYDKLVRGIKGELKIK